MFEIGRNNITKWILKNKNLLILLGIILLSIILSFVNYPNRFALQADQARDVLVVREALRLHQLPIIGPFSASGPYVFGSYWYWFLMIPIGLFYNSLLAPWIFLTSAFVVGVYIMFLTGRKLIDIRFGLLLSFFTAISAAQVQLSTNLILSALVDVLSIFVFYFFVSFLKEKKSWQLFVMAFIIGIAINVHFEAVPLFILIPACLFFDKKNFLKLSMSLMLFIIPFAPLTIFNFNSHFYESSHILLTNSPPQPINLIKGILEAIKREIIFITITEPGVWGEIISSYISQIVGYLIIVLFAILLVVGFYKKIVETQIKLLLVVGLGFVIILGFYSGVLFQDFFSFTYPLVLILTTWTCFNLYKIQKKLAIFLIFFIALVSLFSDLGSIVNAQEGEVQIAQFRENTLVKLDPNQKFAVYNYTNLDKDRGLSLSLFLDVDGKISDSGMKIGSAYVGAAVNHLILFDGPQNTGARIYNLANYSDGKLKNEGFIPEDPYAVYESMEDWYK